MNLFDWTFQTKEGDEHAAHAERAMWSLRASLERSGQVVGESVHGWIGGSLRLTGTLPRPDALSEARCSRYVSRDLAALREHCRHDASTVHPAAHEPLHRDSLEGIPWLMLQTVVGDQTSPLLAGPDQRPVPLYLLPLDPDVLERVFFWARRYQRLHGVELSCGVLERESLLQMTEPTSLLMQEAREHAAAIEAATGIPTYTWLYRYYGPPQGDGQRPCPLCGAAWRQPEADPCPFRCAPCRLASEHAASLDPADWERFRPDRGGPDA